MAIKAKPVSPRRAALAARGQFSLLGINAASHGHRGRAGVADERTSKNYFYYEVVKQREVRERDDLQSRSSSSSSSSSASSSRSFPSSSHPVREHVHAPAPAAAGVYASRDSTPRSSPIHVPQAQHSRRGSSASNSHRGLVVEHIKSRPHGAQRTTPARTMDKQPTRTPLRRLSITEQVVTEEDMAAARERTRRMLYPNERVTTAAEAAAMRRASRCSASSRLDASETTRHTERTTTAIIKNSMDLVGAQESPLAQYLRGRAASMDDARNANTIRVTAEKGYVSAARPGNEERNTWHRSSVAHESAAASQERRGLSPRAKQRDMHGAVGHVAEIDSHALADHDYSNRVLDEERSGVRRDECGRVIPVHDEAMGQRGASRNDAWAARAPATTPSGVESRHTSVPQDTDAEFDMFGRPCNHSLNSPSLRHSAAHHRAHAQDSDDLHMHGDDDDEGGMNAHPDFYDSTRIEQGTRHIARSSSEGVKTDFDQLMQLLKREVEDEHARACGAAHHEQHETQHRVAAAAPLSSQTILCSQTARTPNSDDHVRHRHPPVHDTNSNTSRINSDDNNNNNSNEGTSVNHVTPRYYDVSPPTSSSSHHPLSSPAAHSLSADAESGIHIHTTTYRAPARNFAALQEDALQELYERWIRGEPVLLGGDEDDTRKASNGAVFNAADYTAAAFSMALEKVQQGVAHERDRHGRHRTVAHARKPMRRHRDVYDTHQQGGDEPHEDDDVAHAEHARTKGDGLSTRARGVVHTPSRRHLPLHSPVSTSAYSAERATMTGSGLTSLLDMVAAETVARNTLAGQRQRGDGDADVGNDEAGPPSYRDNAGRIAAEAHNALHRFFRAVRWVERTVRAPAFVRALAQFMCEHHRHFFAQAAQMTRRRRRGGGGGGGDSSAARPTVSSESAVVVTPNKHSQSQSQSQSHLRDGVGVAPCAPDDRVSAGYEEGEHSHAEYAVYVEFGSRVSAVLLHVLHAQIPDFDEEEFALMLFRDPYDLIQSDYPDRASASASHTRYSKHRTHSDSNNNSCDINNSVDDDDDDNCNNEEGSHIDDGNDNESGDYEDDVGARDGDGDGGGIGNAAPHQVLSYPAWRIMLAMSSFENFCAWMVDYVLAEYHLRAGVDEDSGEPVAAGGGSRGVRALVASTYATRTTATSTAASPAPTATALPLTTPADNRRRESIVTSSDVLSTGTACDAEDDEEEKVCTGMSELGTVATEEVMYVGDAMRRMQDTESPAYDNNDDATVCSSSRGLPSNNDSINTNNNNAVETTSQDNVTRPDNSRRVSASSSLTATPPQLSSHTSMRPGDFFPRYPAPSSSSSSSAPLLATTHALRSLTREDETQRGRAGAGGAAGWRQRGKGGVTAGHGAGRLPPLSTTLPVTRTSRQSPTTQARTTTTTTTTTDPMQTRRTTGIADACTTDGRMTQAGGGTVSGSVRHTQRGGMATTSPAGGVTMVRHVHTRRLSESARSGCTEEAKDTTRSRVRGRVSAPSSLTRSAATAPTKDVKSQRRAGQP